jgi:hypothetical protein
MSEIKEIMFEEHPEEKREQLLKDNCYKSEVDIVSIPLTPMETAQADTSIIECSDLIDQLETELAEHKAKFKQEEKRIKNKLIDPQIKLSSALQQKRTGARESEEEVFYFDDQENKLMLCYDKRGILISSRALTPKERQTSIFSMNKKRYERLKLIFMTEKQHHYNIATDNKELIIRHGDAAPIREKDPMRILGNIHAPAEFIKFRKPDPEATHLEFDSEKMKIMLIVDENNELKDIITGQIVQNPYLGEFMINTDHRYSLKKLASLCKKLRFFFKDKEANMELVSSLMNFSGKFEEFIEAQDNQRGDKLDSHSIRMVQNEIPQSFTLSIPVFKGEQARDFEVDILFEKRDKNLSLWLDSPELNEIVIGEVERIFNEERKNFEEYLIIDK